MRSACSRKEASGKTVKGVIRSLVNARGSRFESAMVLHEPLLVPVLTCGIGTMIRRGRRGLGLEL